MSQSHCRSSILTVSLQFWHSRTRASCGHGPAARVAILSHVPSDKDSLVQEKGQDGVTCVFVPLLCLHIATYQRVIQISAVLGAWHTTCRLPNSLVLFHVSFLKLRRHFQRSVCMYARSIRFHPFNLPSWPEKWKSTFNVTLLVHTWLCLFNVCQTN